MPYDPTTPNGYVRMLIGDTDYTNLIFQDSEINAHLSAANNDPFGAGAIAYGCIIRSRALLAQKILREGYTSEAYAMKDLMALKADLEQQSLTAGGLAQMDFEITDEHLEDFRPNWIDITDAQISIQ